MNPGSFYFRTALLVVFLLMGITTEGWSMETVDHGIFEGLLKKYVKNGEVDYAGFKSEEQRLTQYLKLLEQTRTQDLSRNEQLAFYIDAYNACTIKLVLGGYPGIKSIKELGSFLESPWKKESCRIDGRHLSLDDIEHGIIRLGFREPRIHFAVNCASKSCPSLLSEPYRGDVLEQQLDKATRDFINNPNRNYLSGSTLHVSRIFDWYGKDFKEGIVAFFLEYAEGDLKNQLEQKRDRIKIEYLDYDWSLNGK